MNRRETLQLIAIVGAGAVARLSWAQPRADREAELVATIAELIIPETSTPGARAAGVPDYIAAVIADADPPDRDRFQQGLASVDALARERHNTDFVSASHAQQIAMLEILSTTPFFTMVKTLTITGYYTSRAGIREELGDDGRMAFHDYVGCTHADHGVSI